MIAHENYFIQIEVLLIILQNSHITQYTVQLTKL